MSTAYVIQDSPALDFDPALRHAKRVDFILPKGDVNHFTPVRVRAELSNRLAKFMSDDFLVLSGDPELIALSFQILSCSSFPIKLLKYDRLTRTYNLRIHNNL